MHQGQTDANFSTSWQVHPVYKETQWINDFMLVQLESVSDKPLIELNRDPSHPRGRANLTVIGLGVMSEDGYEDAPFLRAVNISHFPVRRCKKKFSNPSWVDRKSMLCAKSRDKDR